MIRYACDDGGCNVLRKAVLSASGLILGCTAALGQAATGRPSFAVTAVRPHVRGAGYEELSCSNGRFITRGSGLDDTIEWAYDIRLYQIPDFKNKAPAWVTQEAYDIEAKYEGLATEQQCKGMVQALLANRFKLAVHWESRQGRVVDLVVAHTGPKLQKALSTDADSGWNVVYNGNPLKGSPGNAKGRTMEQLAGFLATFYPRGVPVNDKTGLEGRYRVNLRFSFQSATDDAQHDPDVETAVQQQLGLKLEERKGMVDFFVVDHIERPTPN